MDAPVDGVTEVHVKITGIEAKAQNGAPFTLTLASAPLTVNLLALTDEESAAILLDEAAVPPGTYEWLAMDVAAELDVVGVGHPGVPPHGDAPGVHRIGDLPDLLLAQLAS